MAKTTAAAWTIESILSAKVPVTVTVSLVIDPDWGVAINEARSKVRRLESQIMTGGERMPEQRRLSIEVDLQAASEDVTRLEKDRPTKVVDFVFGGLSAVEYARLVTENQPTSKQRADANRIGQTMLWNPDTFPRALIAGSLITPRLSTEDVDKLFDDPNWNEQEHATLFQGALAACTTAYRDDAIA